MDEVLFDPKVVWYGPHPCAECGGTVVRAALENGGAMFDPPKKLLDIFLNGSRSGDVDTVYPMQWTPHVHAENRPPAASVSE